MYPNYVYQFVPSFILCLTKLRNLATVISACSVAKNLSPSRDEETRVQSLSWKDCLDEEMAAHSSILAWKIPWTEEAGGLQSMGSQRIRLDWMTEHTHTL